MGTVKAPGKLSKSQVAAIRALSFPDVALVVRGPEPVGAGFCRLGLGRGELLRNRPEPDVWVDGYILSRTLGSLIDRGLVGVWGEDRGNWKLAHDADYNLTSVRPLLATYYVLSDAGKAVAKSLGL